MKNVTKIMAAALLVLALAVSGTAVATAQEKQPCKTECKDCKSCKDCKDCKNCKDCKECKACKDKKACPAQKGECKDKKGCPKKK